MTIFSHYKERLGDILTFRKKGFFYAVLKALCVIVGLPLYVVLLPADFLLFIIYAAFAPIPIFGQIIFAISKGLGYAVNCGYYLAICPDAKFFFARAKARAAAERAEAGGGADEASGENSAAEDNGQK